MKLANILEEGVLDLPLFSTPEQQLEIVQHKVEVARKALGIANRLKDPAQRKEHKGRVLGHLNRLRGLLRRVEAQLEKEMDEEGENKPKFWNRFFKKD